MTADYLFAENLIFVLLTLPFLYVANLRYEGRREFTGPVTPQPDWMRVWTKVAWGVGLGLPLFALIVEWQFGQLPIALLTLGPYFILFFLQIGTEQFCIRQWKSPVWVVVPCLYLPWRLFQIYRGWETTEPIDGTIILDITLSALFVFWVISIAVHYASIPRQMRWDEDNPKPW